MKTLIDKFIDYQIENRLISDEERDTYKYAYIILVEEVLNILIATIIGVYFELFFLVLIFLLSYIPLRRYAGGFHAENGGSCCGISGLIILLICLWFQIMNMPIICFVESSILPIAHFVIFVFAPIDSSNKRLSELEREEYRWKTWIVLSIQILVLVMSWVFEDIRLFYGIGSAHIVLSGMILTGIYKDKRIKNRDIFAHNNKNGF